jgi:glycosyltransferase involved in cell wall biosynthesis
MQYRFHVVGLPHLVTNKTNCACAYTQKDLNFCKMMRSLGHHVTHYGVEGSEVDCDEHVTTISRQQLDELLGKYDHKTQLPDHLKWDPNEPIWQICNLAAAAAINKRKQPRDFLCLIAGTCQQPIWQRAGDHMTCVEYGIGYTGVFAPYRVYESYAHMAKLYGQYGGGEVPPSPGNPTGRNYDVVIPNYYDPVDFPYTPTDKSKQYLLFIGRLIADKGLATACAVADAANMELVVAGQGGTATKQLDTTTKLSTVHGDFSCNKLTFVGHVGVAERAKLMGEAAAVLVPTNYLEPFGGVNVEAQLCGTPAITSDWGAFPETVDHGRTGYRCRTLDHWVWAAKHAHKLDRPHIYQRAHQRWSIYRVRHMYQEYFDMLYDLWNGGKAGGWHTLHPERTQLDWLCNG